MRRVPAVVPEGPPEEAVVVGEPVPVGDEGHPERAEVELRVRLPRTARPLRVPRVRWATEAHGSGDRRMFPRGAKRALLRDLPAGRVWIQVTVTDGVVDAFAAALWVELEAGRRTPIVFDFNRGHVLSGIVVDGDGRPVANRDVGYGEPWSETVDMLDVSTKTDSHGRFRLVGLARIPGSLVIEIPRPATARAGGWSAFGLGPQFQSIDVTPGSRPLRVVAREFDEAQDQLERGPIGQGGGGR